MKNIVFTGGGTAGHYSPNLALIPLVKEDFDNIYYIGSVSGPEKSAMQKAGIPYYGITCVKLTRKFTLKNLAIPFKLLKGVNESEKILKKLSPSVVFSKGGYVALPVAIAAHRLKIPLITHESDLSIGLANKVASKYSTAVLTSFEKTAQTLPNAYYAGTPLREDLFKPRNKTEILKKYDLDPNKKVLLVTGGSQGSKSINEIVQKCAYTLVKRYNVVHLCGKGKAPEITISGYKAIEFAEDMGELYAIADTAVSRAGANTLFELIALAIPTLAIPLPKGNSRGDQIENAKYFSDNGLIGLLLEENLSEKSFLKALDEVENNREKIIENCKKTNYRNSAKAIAKYIKTFK